MPDDVPMVPVDVLGVRRRAVNEEIVVLLLDPDAELVVPIVVGPREAGAIAMGQSGIPAPRPLAHDVMSSILDALGCDLHSVEIVALRDGVFHAELVLDTGARLDARASDAIALAVRRDAVVLCSAEVVALAGVEVVSPSQLEDIDRFRDFLRTVSPEDFTNPQV
ncbi:bifunctional nuclease family protein [Sanguibacter suaedae]|nr:bifunctional nuclease family protein [Sanguibacter suaedae]